MNIQNIEMGLTIKGLREEKAISQSQLAELLGVKQNTISNYENNSARPSYEVLVKLADIFDVSTDYLLGREDF